MEDLLEFQQLLLATLNEELNLINTAYNSGDLSNLRQKVHKLHGAAAFCQVQSLVAILKQLEQAIILGQTTTIAECVKLLNIKALALIS